MTFLGCAHWIRSLRPLWFRPTLLHSRSQSEHSLSGSTRNSSSCRWRDRQSQFNGPAARATSVSNLWRVSAPPLLCMLLLTPIMVCPLAWGEIARTPSTQQVGVLPEAPGVNSSVQGNDVQSRQSATGSSITGTVTDQNGSNLDNAQVILSKAGGSFEHAQETDTDGRFTFRDLSSGAYSIRVTSPGLEQFMAQDILVGTGQTIDLNQVKLFIAPATASVTVSASRVEVAAAQVQLAEKQRVLGILPNFYSSYIWDAAPLTPRLKFNLALRSTADPVTLLITAGLAGVEQAHNTFPGYGTGPKGYAERYGAAYADNVIGRMLGSAILPSLFRQDPRYFYKGHGSITSRALYAIGATVIARGDNGRSQPNYSHLLGNFAAAGIANLYRTSSDRSATLTLRNGLVITGSNAIANLVREFLLRQITSKVPDYKQDMASP